MDIPQAKKIMGKNFIGPEKLKKISSKLNIADPLKYKKSIPKLPVSLDVLKKNSKDYILILGMPKDKNGKKLTINNLRSIFGYDPKKSEPCFYNQDWYLKEKFAKNIALDFKWYLIKKSINKNSRENNPENISKLFKNKEAFPSAILTTFAFFSYYILTNGEILWKHDFIWCSDKDANGDRVYTGRYLDPKKINKNGFNIHRHLSVRSCYGVAPQIV